jgi:hypothetical protein
MALRLRLRGTMSALAVSAVWLAVIAVEAPFPGGSEGSVAATPQLRREAAVRPHVKLPLRASSSRRGARPRVAWGPPVRLSARRDLENFPWAVVRARGHRTVA